MAAPIPLAEQNARVALRLADYGHVSENGRVAVGNDAGIPVLTQGTIPVEKDSVQHRRFTRISRNHGFT